MKSRLVFFIGLMFLLVACSGLTLKSHWDLFGPTVYELTDGNISIKYYNGNCCCIAKEVLEKVKKNVESGKLDWQKMQNKEFADKYLQQVCNELKSN